MSAESLPSLLKAIRSGYSLPLLSPVAMKLVEMASDDSCSAEALATIMEKDPSLSVRVLKLANSAFFHSGRPTASLSQAVVQLGFERLRLMALTLSLRDTFPMGKVGVLDYEGFWHTSLYRAIIGKSLARNLKQGNPEEAFVAGLTVEIGLLILFDLWIKDDENAPPIKLEPLEDLLSWERNRYGVDHRRVGELALGFWRFPDSMIQCQRLYGNAALVQDAPLLSKICELSRMLSRIIWQESPCFHTIFQETERLLGLNREVITDTIVTAFEQVERIADSLRLQVDKDKDLMEVMDKANGLLGGISKIMTENPPSGGPERVLPSLDSIDKGQDGVANTLQAVAHEIRNPLLVIGGFARRLSVSLDPDTKGGQYAHLILDEASRLESILSEMMQKG